MKFILVFLLLLVNIFQYAQADESPEIILPNTELPSMSLPPVPEPTMYDTVMLKAGYYTNNAYNGLSQFVTKPFGYFSNIFTTSSSTSKVSGVDIGTT